MKEPEIVLYKWKGHSPFIEIPKQLVDNSLPIAQQFHYETVGFRKASLIPDKYWNIFK